MTEHSYEHNSYPLRTLTADMGFIVGVIEPNFYKNMHPASKEIGIQWDIDFPDWKNKTVYYVQYETPKKIMSRDEFEEQNPHIKKEFLEWEYDKVPERNIMCIPEDGLSLASDEEIEEMNQILEDIREKKRLREEGEDYDPDTE